MEDTEYILVQRYKNDGLKEEITVNIGDKNKIPAVLEMMENFLGVNEDSTISKPKKSLNNGELYKNPYKNDSFGFK